MTLSAKVLTFCITALALFATAAAQPPADPCAALKEENQEMQAKLRDWPNLAKYGAANATLAAPAKGEARVVFLGDSITEMWNLAESFPGKPYVNRGIGGQTTPQMVLRFRQDVIALKPKVVVILAGTNDIAENTGPISVAAIEDNFASMVDLAKRSGIRVVLSALVPAGKYSWRPEIAPVEKIRELNQWIQQFSAKEGLVYLDYFTPMADPQRALKSDLSEDGVHPTKAGYAVMAPLAEKAIATALKGKPPAQ